MSLCGVARNRLILKGALIVNIKSSSRETKEVLYVCENVKDMYLSQTALKNMNIVHNDFPATPKSILNLTTTTNPSDSASNGTSPKVNLAPCGCSFHQSSPALPDKIPFPATGEYRQQIQDWIKKRYSASAFNTCPHQMLQVMKEEPLQISFAEEHTPYAAHKPIPVPHHWKEEVKRKLDADVALSSRCPKEPQRDGVHVWSSYQKKDGSPRRTVDLQNLNKVTLRETHHTPSPFNIVSVVLQKKNKTVLDAWNGYHSLPLSPSARDATTFITEWGRYRYLRATLRGSTTLPPAFLVSLGA